MANKKERNHYDLKEIENRRNAKLAWIALGHTVLMEMFAIEERLALLYEKAKLLISLISAQVGIIVWCFFCR